MATATAKKKNKAGKGEPGEQQDLIDVMPKNHKKIVNLSRAYKKAQKVRVEALAEEIKWKGALLEEVKAAGIVTDPDGGYKFKCDGVVIKVTPRDELLQVKFEDEEGNGKSDDPTA